ncbi:MAG: hypothetical protein SRB1_02510 [Desulfobacteraceae bacterium Eth-SRB1]|nr:MAG: hypothetical protein SRB1_02510 [Desulfobacteraceae bacterium Eth-SRB1]
MEKPKKIFLFSLLVFLIISSKPLYGKQFSALKGNGVSVLFEEPLKNAAKEVANIYPTLIAELEKTLKWKLDYTPGVILIKERETFQKMAGSELVVAYAVPRRGLVVIDYSRMNNTPFTLRITLKHELCHLLLHRHIQEGRLPKWLDEGVAQWVSDGFGEIIMDRSKSFLIRAVLTGKYIPVSELTVRFPKERQALVLAYDESKSLIEYIAGKFGSDSIVAILENLKDGYDINQAIEKGISISLYELEKQWRARLSKRLTWLIYLSNNVYGILFFLAALLTIVGFIRYMKKKIDYKDEDDDDIDRQE